MTKLPHDKFPKQSTWVGKPLNVLFEYREPQFPGVMVREDIEAPFVTIIKLDDGRYVLGTEVQYQVRQ